MERICARKTKSKLKLKGLVLDIDDDDGYNNLHLDDNDEELKCILDVLPGPDSPSKMKNKMLTALGTYSVFQKMLNGSLVL